MVLQRAAISGGAVCAELLDSLLAYCSSHLAKAKKRAAMARLPYECLGLTGSELTLIVCVSSVVV